MYKIERDKFEKHIEELTKKAEVLFAELEDEKNLRKEAQKTTKLLRDRLDNVGKKRKLEKENWEIEKKKNQTQIDLKDGELATKKTRIKDLQKRLTELDTNHKTLQTELVNIQNRERSLQAKHSALELECTNLEQAGLKLLDAYSSKEQEINQITEQLKSERVIAKSFYQSQKNQFQQQNQTDRDNFLNSLRNKQNSIEELEDYLDNSNQLLGEKNYQITDKNREIQEREQIITQLQVDLNNQLREVNSELTETEEVVEVRTKKVIELVQTIQNQSEQIDKLTQKGNQKQKQIILLSQQLATDQNKNKDLTELLTEKRKENNQLTNQFKQLQARLKKAQAKTTRGKQYQQNRTNNLQVNLNNAETKRDNYLVELNQLDQDFREQEQLLAEKNAKLSQEITKTNNLTLTVVALQNQIDNHTCPTWPVHACSLCPLIHCSRADYQESESERKRKRENYQQQIIQRLNTAFNLGLDQQEKSLDKVILKIQALINKPPETIYEEFANDELAKKLDQAQQTIVDLEKELAAGPTKNLEIVKDIDLKVLEMKEKKLNLSFTEAKQQIKNMTSYQELSALRNGQIEEFFQQKQAWVATIQQQQQQFNSQRIILISLLLVSLISIGGLMVRLRKSNRKQRF